MPRTRNTGLKREALLAACVLFLLAFAWMPTAGVSLPNERSRIYLAVSLVDQHTLAIDGPLARWGSIFDLAQFNGHNFTDKAPGASFLAAAVYGACRMFKPASALSIETLLTLMRWTIMLPMGVLSFLLFRKLARRLGMNGAIVNLTSLTWILGTAAAHASASFFGHQIVSACLVGALLLLLKLEDRCERSGGPTWHLALAVGAIAGFSVLTEYQSAVPFGLLAIYVLAGPLRRRPALLAWLVLGSVPGALGLLIYNRLAFGGFFQLSYHHLVSPGLQQLHGRGIGGVAMPRAQYAMGALLSWHRGLFATSPFFLLAAPGLLALWHRGRRRLALLLGSACAYYMLFVCSTEIWYAGWGFGPRLMVPVMGWAALVAGLGLASLRRGWVRGAALGLCLWGVLCTQLVNVVFPELPERFTNPLVGLVIPALREGVLVPNLMTRLLGWTGLPSLIPFALVLAGLLVLAVRGFASAIAQKGKGLALGAVLVLGLLAAMVRATGPTTPVESTTRQLHWMRQLLVDEKALWKRR